jgi:hypothetical protein
MLLQRGNHSYYLIARRRLGVTEQAAMAAVRGYGEQVGAQFSDRRLG